MIEKYEIYDLKIREIKYELSENLELITRKFQFVREKGLKQILLLIENYNETEIKIYNILQKKIDFENNGKN
jgi:hypothetical protein